jgi:two-component system sensor histidine kinase KdpD
MLRTLPRLRQLGWLLTSWGAVGAVTAAYVLWIGTTNHTIAALSYLLVVLIVAALSTLWVAISTSILAFLCFNFFFFPPVGTFRIDYAEDWVSLFTLLAVSIVASQLSARARRQAQEAMAQRDELSRLLDERARLLKEREDAELVRRSNELKSALLASLSHDLRTPLTAVTVAANNLKAAWLSDRDRQEQTEIVLAELARLNRLFQNLVDMARIEINAVAAEREWVQPAEIVEAAIRQAEDALGDRRVELDLMAEKMLVRLDPRLTSAALAHLLENAAHYSPPSSPITVQVALSADEVCIAVRDRGIGIAPEDLRHLFDRSYRGRNNGHHRFGTGMGLTITRGLLAAQDGRVVAENAPGGGSVFTITMPAEMRSAPDLEEPSV